MSDGICARCHGTGRAVGLVVVRGQVVGVTHDLKLNGRVVLCGACDGLGRERDPDARDCEWCGREVSPIYETAPPQYPRDEDGDVCCLECLALAPVCDA